MLSQLGPLQLNMLNMVTPLLKYIHCTHWGSGGSWTFCGNRILHCNGTKVEWLPAEAAGARSTHLQTSLSCCSVSPSLDALLCLESVRQLLTQAPKPDPQLDFNGLNLRVLGSEHPIACTHIKAFQQERKQLCDSFRCGLQHRPGLP